jgi:hypothetical protein
MSHDKRFSISRRPFLAGLSTAAAGMVLRPVLAEAQGMVPQRLLIIHRPCGTVMNPTYGNITAPLYWWPQSGTGANYTASPLLASFDAVKANMMIVKGINCPRNEPVNGDKHGQGIIGMMSGIDAYQPPGTSKANLDDPNSKSISSLVPTFDQVALNVVPALKGGTFPSIQAAGTRISMTGSGPACLRVMSYSGPNQPMWGEGRSDVLFNNVFGGTTTPTTDPALIAAQSKRMFDLVASDLGRLKAAAPSSQWPKLDAHLEAINQLKNRVVTPPPTVACTKPTLGAQTRTGTGIAADESEHIALSKNMLAVIRTAFQCDLTRVATFTFAHGNSFLRPKNYVPGASTSTGGDHHAVSHAADSLATFTGKGQTDKMYADILAEALLAMQNTPEGSGTMLDNTLVVYFSECSWGNDHSQKDNPIAFFGGKFVKPRLGQYIQLSPTVYMNDVWSAILAAWGVPPDTMFGGVNTSPYGNASSVSRNYAKGAVSGLFG